MFILNQILLIFLYVCACRSVQIPTYNLTLNQNEEFVISELLSSSDVEDIYDEEEMIQEEAKKVNNGEKYWRVHRQSNQRNRKANLNKPKIKMEPFWSNISNEEYLQKYSNEYKEPTGKNKQHEILKRNEDDYGPNNFYIDDDDKTNRTLSYKNFEKREYLNETKNETENYDYEAFKAAYEKEIKNEEKKNETLKYNETKEDEKAVEAIKTLVDFSPRNCTEEEKSKLSFASVECLWVEVKNPHFEKKTKLNIVEKVVKIVLVWVLVYLMIALPLWCQYGWCCCCCQCKFCKPRDRIKEVKSFYVRNPVGIFHDEKGQVLKYEPTSSEKYAQKKLGKAIDRL